MKILIASTGLGSIKRGIESWAEDTFNALIEKGVDVHLAYGGANTIPGSCCHKVWCMRRNNLSTVLLSTVHRYLGGWRYGLGSPYQIEQTTFVPGLKRLLKKLDADILHVQDPWLALLMQKLQHKGKIRTKTILARGTEEDMEFLDKIDYLQELSPFNFEKHAKIMRGRGESSPTDKHRCAQIKNDDYVLPAEPDSQTIPVHLRSSAVDNSLASPASPATIALHRLSSVANESSSRHRFMIPNFIDTSVFKPFEPSAKSVLRGKYGIPPDALVVGCVAAVKKDHKRIDCLIREFAESCKTVREGLRQNEQNIHNVCEHLLEIEKIMFRLSGSARAENSVKSLYLVIAGSRCVDSEELIALAESLVPGRYKILLDLSHEKMPELLGTMDVFVLCSLFEMMPIALIEALASGLPCIANKHSNLEWIIGDGGWNIDLCREGNLAELIGCLTADKSRRSALTKEDERRLTQIEKGVLARKRAEAMSSRDVVVPQMITMYEEVNNCK